MDIAIFASGGGSNASVIIKNLSNHIDIKDATIKLVLTNNPNAGVLHIAKESLIATEVVNLKQKDEKEAFQIYKEVLQKHKIDFIVLAGYLKKIPAELTKLYPRKIVNIHPAILPAYGGAGMYGAKVHEAVIAAKEKKSGITIHFVDEIYDHGEIIFQATCAIEDGETPHSLAQKILALEHKYFTKIIAEIIPV